MALEAIHRLHREDFRNVSERGKTARSSFLFMQWIRNAARVNRFGFIVSLKVSRRAVVRNRVRRLLAECVRHHVTFESTTYDVVVVARSGAATVPGAQVCRDLVQLMNQANIVS